MGSFPYQGSEMRTYEEINRKIGLLENDPNDIFGFIKGDLICCLPYDQAKPFFKKDSNVTEESWNANKLATDRDGVLVAMREYMTFAWDKANNCRGLSACRSLMHYQAWLWLLGEDEVADMLALDYSCYGKPELRAICEHYGWDWTLLDNGRWSNKEHGFGDPLPARDLPWRVNM